MHDDFDFDLNFAKSNGKDKEILVLDERKSKILKAIIDEYIYSATPVGSRVLSKRSDIGLSSATIRNVMSDLEELGYLDQPHTSAGRVPSDKAYRLYVDSMMPKKQISNEERDLIRIEVNRHIDDLSDLAGKTARCLSEITKLPSVVSAQENDDINVQHVQIVPVTQGKALAVIVSDAATVFDALIDIPGSLGVDELERASRILTTNLIGKSLLDAVALLTNTIPMEFGEFKRLVEYIGSEFTQSINKKTPDKIMLGGAANLFSYPEFTDFGLARQMLNALETTNVLRDIVTINDGEEVRIRIGQENNIDEMKGSSIITARYKIGNRIAGSIGVIGPTRMDYSRIAAVVEIIADQLNIIFDGEDSSAGKGG